MGQFEDKLEELQKRVLGNKQNHQDSESILVFDAETDHSMVIDVDLNEITDDRELEFFFDDKVRKVWHKQEEEWFFSIIDICQVLTDSTNPKNYWNMLKQRMTEIEKSELYTKCVQLKMKSKKDGKHYLTDTLDTEGIFRLIESVPSPNAEPFKLWLAKLGRQEVDNTFDPSKGIDKMIDYYLMKGYSLEWIESRIKAILNRKKLLITPPKLNPISGIKK